MSWGGLKRETEQERGTEQEAEPEKERIEHLGKK